MYPDHDNDFEEFTVTACNLAGAGSNSRQGTRFEHSGGHGFEPSRTVFARLTIRVGSVVRFYRGRDTDGRTLGPVRGLYVDGVRGFYNPQEYHTEWLRRLRAGQTEQYRQS